MKDKRIIAREILIFFSGIVIVLVLWGVISLRNTYYHHIIDVTENEIKASEDKIQTRIKKGELKPITDPALLKELDEAEEVKSPEEIRLSQYSSHLIYDDELQQILLIVSLVIAGIIYVLRFVIILILWAIKIIKQPV